MKFSVAIIAQNENNPVFRACLDSALNSFGADEIVIVDGGSTDRTQRMVYDVFGHKNVKILTRPFKVPADYTDNRNYAIDNCTGDWILSLDADEVLSDNSFLLKEIITEESAPVIDLEGTHYLYNLNLLDNTVEHHIFLSRLFKNIPKNRYPPNSMHGTIPNPERHQLPGIYIHHFGYIKGLLTYMINKWETESKHWEIHRPEQYQAYINQVLTGSYPVKARDVEIPSALKLNRFLI